MKLKEMLEARKKHADALKALNDKANAENRSFSPDEQKAWEEQDAAYNDLTKRIDVAKRAEEIDQEQRGRLDNGPIPGREDRDPRQSGDEDETREDDEVRSLLPWDRASKSDQELALRGMIMGRDDPRFTERHDRAMRAAGVRGNYVDIPLLSTRDLSKLSREFRAAQSSLVLADGGALVGGGLMGALEMALLQFGGVRQVATIVRTDTGAELPFPTSNDTSNEGRLVTENASRTTETPLQFGAVALRGYTYSSDWVKAPFELIEDSSINIDEMVGAALGERLGRIQNRHFTVGDGAAKPKGISVSATAGVTAASASALTADELIRLQHSVDVAYRSMATWMFHDTTHEAIRKLKDGDGNYLLQRSLADGAPETLLGKPIQVNNHMAEIAASARTILFGAMKKYVIREVRSIRLMRAVELYAQNGQVGFIAHARADAALINAGTNPVKALDQNS